jgi:antitoxin (DNA-binding transcriptional repressor) of toxin-antitoxin stability system
MPHIVLTDEQVRVLSESQGPVEVLDTQGRPVASLTTLDAADLEAIERYKRNRGKQEPGIPAEQVQAHFRRLEEIREKEGMDLPKALELLRRMRAGEQV